MDLTSLYRMVSSEAPSVPEQMMRGAANQAALQQADEQLMANKRLRELYERGNPSIQELGAISPEYAQKVQQFNNEQLMQQMKMLEMQGGMEETKRKTQEAKQHTFANTIGPLIENWQEGLGGKQPTQQDLEAFKGKLGGALKFLDETYSYKPDVPLDPYHPEHILGTAESLGYASRRSKFAEERQKAQLDVQREAGKRALPEVVLDQFNNPVIKPGVPDTSDFPKLQKTPTITFEGTTYSGPQFAQAITGEKDPERKQKMNEYLDASIKSTREGIKNAEIPLAGTTDVATEKAKIVKAEEEAKQAVQEKGAAKKATMAYEMLPDPDRIRNLIKGSISGDTEYWANRLGGIVGKSLESGDLTGALKVIEGQMADTVAMFPGAQSDKELEARMKTIGNPSGEISSDTRLKAFDEWLNRMQKYAAQHAEYDDNQLVDMVKVGKLTADQALQVRKKRMSGGL